jgi:hypothetical protein
MNIYFIAGSPRKNVSSTVCTHTSCTSTCWFYLPVYMHRPSRLQLLHLELVQNNSCHQEIPGNKNAQLPLHVCIPACFFCCVPSYLKTCTFIPYKVSPNIFFVSIQKSPGVQGWSQVRTPTQKLLIFICFLFLWGQLYFTDSHCPGRHWRDRWREGKTIRDSKLVPNSFGSFWKGCAPSHFQARECIGCPCQWYDGPGPNSSMDIAKGLVSVYPASGCLASSSWSQGGWNAFGRAAVENILVELSKALSTLWVVFETWGGL